MPDKYFIDTNVFVYAFDASAPEKQQRAHALIREALSQHSGCISSQVIQGFINVATRKFAVPLKITDCEQYLNTVLAPLCEVFTSLELYRRALDIMERWQYGFYDALIIAAALQSECDVLCSEDLQDGQRIQGLTIRNPFAV